MCLPTALLPVSCSPTNKNISVAGKDEQAWLPSHGLNYSRGRKDSWTAGKEQGYLRRLTLA